MNAGRRRSGLTLIEVLVAMLFISVAALALVGIQVLSLRVTRSSQQASDATQLAVATLTARTVAVVERFSEFQKKCPGDEMCSGFVEEGGIRADWSVARPTGYMLDGLLLVDVQVSGAATARMATYV